jgi:hypothetical protein
VKVTRITLGGLLFCRVAIYVARHRDGITGVSRGHSKLLTGNSRAEHDVRKGAFIFRCVDGVTEKKRFEPLARAHGVRWIPHNCSWVVTSYAGKIVDHYISRGFA